MMMSSWTDTCNAFLRIISQAAGKDAGMDKVAESSQAGRSSDDSNSTGIAQAGDIEAGIVSLKLQNVQVEDSDDLDLDADAVDAAGVKEKRTGASYGQQVC